MRIPLQTYGFSLEIIPPILDLRNAVEGTEDILYFLTLRYLGRGSRATAIRFINDQDDGPIMVFPGLHFEPLFERIPVRGPVAVVFNIGGHETFIGHAELEGQDYPTFFIPLATQVFDDVSTASLVCRIESSVNLSLFVHSPHDSKCTLRFVPDEPGDWAFLAIGLDLESGQPDNGFVQVFDRMPVRGPGRIVMDIDSVAGGSISLYGFLSD
jgi:hypothetical protein